MRRILIIVLALFTASAFAFADHLLRRARAIADTRSGLGNVRLAFQFEDLAAASFVAGAIALFSAIITCTRSSERVVVALGITMLVVGALWVTMFWS